jgi:hypothetical protein
MMATGRSMQLTRQIGEHLVAAELGRRGYVAAPFAGNVPMFDLLAADVRGFAVPVQVKAINSGGSWQFNADTFLEIEFLENRQTIKGNIPLVNPELLCIFVLLKDGGTDEFYIFYLRDLQRHIGQHYGDYLKLKGGQRPQRPESKHCALSPKDLAPFRDNWKLLKNCFPPGANPNDERQIMTIPSLVASTKRPTPTKKSYVP